MAGRQITSTSYPNLHIRVKLRGYKAEGIAIVDTGFTGHLAIPDSIFNGNLGLPDSRVYIEIADGGKVSAPVYFGIVELVGLASIPSSIIVLGNNYLLGRGVLDHFRVTFDHGKKITVEA